MRDGEVTMSDYEVYVFCNECSDVHLAELRIELQYGPADKQSVGDFYSGEELPTVLALLFQKSNRYLLP